MVIISANNTIWLTVFIFGFSLTSGYEASITRKHTENPGANRRKQDLLALSCRSPSNRAATEPNQEHNARGPYREALLD